MGLIFALLYCEKPATWARIFWAAAITFGFMVPLWEWGNFTAETWESIAWWLLFFHIARWIFTKWPIKESAPPEVSQKALPEPMLHRLVRFTIGR